MMISAEDLLDMINPTNRYDSANIFTHDVTFDDAWLMLEMLKESDVGLDATDVTAEVQRWVGLVVLLTDNADVASWRDNLDSVSAACGAKVEK